MWRCDAPKTRTGILGAVCRRRQVGEEVLEAQAALESAWGFGIDFWIFVEECGANPSFEYKSVLWYLLRVGRKNGGQNGPDY